MLSLRLPRKRMISTILLSLVALIFLFSQARNTTDLLLLERSTSYKTSWTELEHGSTWARVFSGLKNSADDVVGTVQELKWFEEYVLYGDSMKVDLMNDLQTKVFPYLDIRRVAALKVPFGPVWKRWDKRTFVNSLPRFSPVDNAFIDVQEVQYDARRSFWWNWLEGLTQAHSKGIVISVSEGQASDAIRLIRVLRYLKNNLPIEISHKGDLSEFTQGRLIEAARKDETDAFPPQELWFVDISGILEPAFSHRFKRFSNKWLALLFTSFEKPILLDADTVPFSNLDQYYDFPQFTAYGSLFFKDRKLVTNLLSKSQRRKLTKVARQLLTPKGHAKMISDKELYSSVKDPSALESLENLLKKGYKHHVDSGLVVIDKKLHLFDILTSLALQFSSVSEYFHGDKEWFWLSQLLRGVPYTFYPVEASSIGKLEPLLSNDRKEFFKVCSIQLAHTSSDGSLLWLNGGLNICKLNSWEYDYTKRSISASFDSPEDLRTYYQSEARLEAIIIPDFENYPWINTEICAKYEYCAFYEVGKKGKQIKLTESDRNLFHGISQVWHN